MPADKDVTTRDGLKLFVPEAAHIKVPEALFVRNPIEAQIVLSGVRDAGDVLGPLLDGGHSAYAGRLAGAFHLIGRADMADEILKVMNSADYDVRESDPFEPAQEFGALIGTQRFPADLRVPVVDPTLFQCGMGKAVHIPELLGFEAARSRCG